MSGRRLAAGKQDKGSRRQDDNHDHGGEGKNSALHTVILIPFALEDEEKSFRLLALIF
jgi:hypothetical protein